MEKENNNNIEAFKSDLIDALKSYTENDWYRLFLVVFLNSKNEELDNLHEKILNCLNDSFAISSIKKRYELGEEHKRLW